MQRHARGVTENGGKVDRTKSPKDQRDAKRETNIADSSDDERLLARVRSRFSGEVETDEKIGTQSHTFPPDKHQRVIGSGHEREHHEEKKIQIGKKAIVAAFVLHVSQIGR